MHVSASSDMPELAGGMKSQDLDLSQMVSTSAGSVPSGAVTPSGSRIALPPLTDFLDAALDRPATDLTHLMDPLRGETPMAFVSKRGLQQAVDGLTDNFRSWLDAIHQSILAALQSKADSTQVEDVARQVQEAAGRASDSVASFAKRAIGGHCASCDAPLGHDAMRWRRPAPSSSQGRWMPNKSLGAHNAIRPPTVGGAPLPACGASRLPKLTDFRQHALSDRLVHRDFPKGKVLKNVASEPEMKILGLS